MMAWSRVFVLAILILFVASAWTSLPRVVAPPPEGANSWMYRALLPTGKTLIDFFPNPHCPIYGSLPSWLSPSLGILRNESAIFIHLTGDLGAQVPSSIHATIQEPNGTVLHQGDCDFQTDSHGNYEITFPIWTLGSSTNPAPMGIWSADVEVEGHFATNGTSSRMGISFSFTVGKYYAEVSVSGMPGPPQYPISQHTVPALLVLDGSEFDYVDNVTATIALGWLPQHKLSIEDFTPTEDSRYHSNDTFTVSGPGNYIFTVNLQYLLTVSAEYELDGCDVCFYTVPVNWAGWYNAGQTVVLNATAPVPLSSGTRAVFRSWIGVNATTPVLSIVMDGPKAVGANYQLQYYLKVVSPVGDPKGEGWYDQQSVANFSVSSTPGISVPLAFVGWTGDSNATSTSASITMNSPKTVVALWRTVQASNTTRSANTSTNAIPSLTNIGTFPVESIAGGVVAGLVALMILRNRKRLKQDS